MDRNDRPPSRCQQIIDLIDDCLADLDAGAPTAPLTVPRGSRR